MISRRLLMFGAVAGATTGSLAIAGPFMSLELLRQLLNPQQKGRRGVALANAMFGDWSVQKETLFTVDTGQIVELVAVKAFRQHSDRPRNLRPLAFTITFEVKKGAPLTEDRIYRLNHNEGGEFDLFMSAAGPDAPTKMIAVLG